MDILNYCESCRAKHTFSVKEEPHVYRFRGRDIEIERRFAFCNCCGSPMDIEGLENETMSHVARIYAEKYGMTASQLQSVRKQYQLGVRPFAKLLGIGSASVTRYESGSLPQVSHLELYKQLRQHSYMIMEYFNRNKDLLSPREQKMTELALEAWQDTEYSFQTDEQIIESIYKPFEATDMAGYSDFLYFKRQRVPISGATYVKYPYGPVPKDHDLAFAHLQQMKVIEIDEQTNEEGWSLMTVKAFEPFDESLFSEDELETMREIEACFKDFGSRKISEYAHHEQGWVETGDKEPISYKYAEKLRGFQG